MAVLLAASGAACANSAVDASPTPRPPASIPADPAAAFAAAKALFGRESVKVALVAGDPAFNYTGVVESGTNNWEVKGDGFVVRRIGPKFYVQGGAEWARQDFSLTPAAVDHLAAGGWVHSAAPEHGYSSTVLADGFPWNLSGSVTRATGFTKTGDRSFEGRMPGRSSNNPVSTQPPRQYEIRVELDEQGRFAAIRFEPLPKAPGQSFAYTFSEYGLQAKIAAPPAEDVLETPYSGFLDLLLPT
ncbi:hypothetical protein [Actinoplanes solisilvae]|uniref:hypothetical protein n=1 Tax=Actinoplanes solisilvae TaxID=2486853 RepID=UPI000FDC6A7C|nr:hypothetical protein [Actinoplanes solisilvae]